VRTTFFIIVKGVPTLCYEGNLIEEDLCSFGYTHYSCITPNRASVVLVEEDKISPFHLKVKRRSYLGKFVVTL
jgi:hypothetical protein